MTVPPILESQPAPGPTPLAKITYPPYVLVLALVTLVAFGIGLVRMPKSISSGIRYERARRDLQAGKPAQAVSSLKELSDTYPSDDDVKIDLADAYAHSGNLSGAEAILDGFDGKEVSNDQGDHLDQIAAFLKSQDTGASK